MNELTGSTFAKTNRHYATRELTPREKIAYRMGRITGRQSMQETPGVPHIVTDGTAPSKVSGHTDHTRISIGYVGDGSNSIYRYVDVYQTSDYETHEQARQIKLVDINENATNIHAATDYSAHTTEVVSEKDLLQPLDPEEIPILQRQFDMTLAYSEAMQRES